MSIIDLHNPLIIAMMNRPAKFITDQEMNETIGNLYNGMQADGLRAANQIATGFVRDYTGSFAYVLNTKRDVAQFDAVPSSKLKGILNVMRREAISKRDGVTYSTSKFPAKGAGRGRPASSAAPAVPMFDTGLDITAAPTGTVLLANDIAIHVERPGTSSKWAGWVFITGGVDHQTFQTTPKMLRKRLGSQKPGAACILTIEDQSILNMVNDWLQSWCKAPATPAPAPVAAKPAPKAVVKMVPVPVPVPPAQPPTVPAVESIRDRVRSHYRL
jgi:hypothetical protein